MLEHDQKIPFIEPKEKFLAGINYLNTISDTRHISQAWDNENIPMIIDTMNQCPSLTNAILRKRTGTNVFIPTVILNPIKIASANPDDIAADYIRTHSVLSFWKRNGYGERRITVMRNAIEDQRLILVNNRNHFPATLPFHPVPMNRKEENTAIKILLSSPVFFTDIGYKDWQNAADQIQKEKEPSHPWGFDIPEFRDNVSIFLNAREYNCPKLFWTSMAISGKSEEEESFSLLSEDQRAEITAKFLLQYLLEIKPRSTITWN